MLHTRSIQAITVAAFMCLSAFAQTKPVSSSCPRERTQTIAADITWGPAQNCSGGSVELGGVQVQFPANTCPLNVIYTPQHEIAVPSQNNTLVHHISLEKVTFISFRCDRSYLIIVPWGWTCVADRQFTLGPVMRMVTAPCSQL